MTSTARKPINVAIYARCSDIKQAEKELSIPAQLDAARAEAKRQGWEVVAEYVDSALTGKDDDRAQFLEMMRIVRTKKPVPFHRIVVWKLSRFMRNRYQSAIYKTQLRKLGVLVVSLNEPHEDNAAGRLMEGVIEAFDQYYSEALGEDTSRGMRKNASLGFYNGGTVPTGYRVERKGSGESPKGVLAPDPIMAPIVQRMFRMCLDGEGANSVRRALNSEGLQTHRGKHWSVSTVLSILRNVAYTGVRVWGVKTEHRKDGELVEPIRVEDSHPALVSVEDFVAVQALIKTRTRDRIHPKVLNGNYLLSGLLHCAGCGSVLIGHPAKSGTVHYYWCARRMKCGPEACDGKLLNQQAAEAAVAERLRSGVLTEEHITLLLAQTNAEILARGKAASGEVEAIEAKLDDARKRLDRLYNSLETGHLEPEIAGPRIKQWKQTVTQLEVQRADLHDTSRDEPILIGEDKIRQHVAEMRRLLDHGSVAARRAFLRAWIKRIDVKERTLSIEYVFPAGSHGGGDLTTIGGDAEVGQAPRKKGGGTAGGKGGAVNAPSSPSTGRTGPGVGSVLSTGQDGSPSRTLGTHRAGVVGRSSGAASPSPFLGSRRRRKQGSWRSPRAWRRPVRQ